MFIDMVFPNKNENSFILLAEKLGIGGLCFVYDLNLFDKTKFSSLKGGSGLKLFSGILIDKRQQFQKAKQLADIVIIKSKGGVSDRGFLEKTSTNAIFDLECSDRSDFLHQRNSGLNHVHCTIAVKKNVSFGVSFSNLLSVNKFLRSLFFGRIKQNFFLCKKYKSKMFFASFAKKPYSMRSPKDLQSFLISLGVDNLIAKNATNELSRILSGLTDECLIMKGVRKLE